MAEKPGHLGVKRVGAVGETCLGQLGCEGKETGEKDVNKCDRKLCICVPVIVPEKKQVKKIMYIKIIFDLEAGVLQPDYFSQTGPVGLSLMVPQE